MATKATTVVREIALPIDRVREIAVSEEFLLTLGGEDGSSMRLRDGHREVHADGSVDATVTAVVGEGDGTVDMVQRTEISEVRADGSFSVFTSVPLPKDIGTMATNQVYRAAGEGTLLESTVAVEVHVALVGGKIAEQVLTGVPASTEKGVARILRLAER
ncbi:DUF2505 family protein [uncultured Corynebacterium sp.]|uniref:DUF2505 family protein n=1 Tax=uncultured Corynebacterium sp. TaxID=159447 RepID=UPI0025ED585C|nr:DUF2505 family protein [uncultured Corynebacterium sp.]